MGGFVSPHLNGKFGWCLTSSHVWGPSEGTQIQDSMVFSFPVLWVACTDNTMLKQYLPQCVCDVYAHVYTCVPVCIHACLCVCVYCHEKAPLLKATGEERVDYSSQPLGHWGKSGQGLKQRPCFPWLPQPAFLYNSELSVWGGSAHIGPSTPKWTVNQNMLPRVAYKMILQRHFLSLYSLLSDKSSMY